MQTKTGFHACSGTKCNTELNGMQTTSGGGYFEWKNAKCMAAGNRVALCGSLINPLSTSRFHRLSKIRQNISNPMCSKNTELTAQKEQHPFGLKQLKSLIIFRLNYLNFLGVSL